ncbi:MAG TPA: DUF2505 family protein [Myxococcota bacterium]|nr:DUF2505 family protein [Myxococcota bacterium]HRY96299.1 DUF2505 family protein [Myxococcota bacterium]HSA23135.1 DUF2505 family protein [Myxococcota bacterium]
MAKHLTQTALIPRSPDEVLATLNDPGVLVDQARLQGAKEARVEETRRDARRLVQVVHLQEYARGLTGVDRSRTDPAATTYEWDLGDRSCRWRYLGVRGERVGLSGSITIRPAPGEPAAGARASQVTFAFDIDVRVPLLGGLIERLIAREVEKGSQDHAQYLRKRLGA